MTARGDSAFWRGRRVLVTGHTGFKGPWLCRSLLHAGAEVMGYSLPAPMQPSLFELLDLASGVRHVEGDIRDLDHMTRCFETFQPELVFHLAAQSLVLESYRAPLDTFSTNVMGTANVLESVRLSSSVAVCVVVTSDKCYEPAEPPRAHEEGDPMGGVDPYSASKGCAEIVAASYRRALLDGNRVRLATVRAGNVIGGGDWSPDRLIPDIVRALTTDTTLELRHPDAVRPWQHVLEPVGGYLLLAERLLVDAGLVGGWNFGPRAEDVWPVRRVVSVFSDLWGAEQATRVRLVDSPYHETGYLSLASGKAHAQLGWAPRWSVDEAIARTASWYHGLYEGGEAAAALVDADINAYRQGPQETADLPATSGGG